MQAARVNEAIADADRACSRSARAAWQGVVDESLKAGAARIHRWPRLPQHVVLPKVTAPPLTQPTGLPSNILEAEVTKYRGCWQSSCVAELPYSRRLVFGDHGFQQWAVQHIRASAKHFATSTCQSFDGFHLRHWSMLCSAGTSCLARLLFLCVKLGTMPPQHRLVTMILLAKPSGEGNRVVASFSSLYRLTQRMLKPLASMWEAAHQWPWASYTAGNSCLRAVWSASQRAEQARARGLVVTLALLDFAAYFEHLPRDRLAQEAHRLGFPLPVLNLSLTAYAYDRSIFLFDIA